MFVGHIIAQGLSGWGFNFAVLVVRRLLWSTARPSRFLLSSFDIFSMPGLLGRPKPLGDPELEQYMSSTNFEKPLYVVDIGLHAVIHIS